MKYKCMVLDHDDTVVESTKTVHYPSFMEFLKDVRPDARYSFEEYIEKNFNPGLIDFFEKELKLSKEEQEEEVNFWNEYVQSHIPMVFYGFRNILSRFKKEGGIICVVSHSIVANILRDYKANRLPVPDAIYGWDSPADERKPSPYPLFKIMEKFNLKPEEIIVVDDLKPGFDMAKKCNIDFACAGWAYDVPSVKNYMLKHSDFYLENVEELNRVLF